MPQSKKGSIIFSQNPLRFPFSISFSTVFLRGLFSRRLLDPKISLVSKSTRPTLPKITINNPIIKFWGTRGSNAVSGSEYIRFGGNTVCLEVRHGEDLLIIDAGTGIRPLGKMIDTNVHKTIHIFLSHTHWDHVTGFPFFDPIYDPDVQIVVWSPVGFEKSTRELFTEMLAYSYFPVRLEDIRAKISFNDLARWPSCLHRRYHHRHPLCLSPGRHPLLQDPSLRQVLWLCHR